jgi:hypothetical protein
VGKKPFRTLSDDQVAQLTPPDKAPPVVIQTWGPARCNEEVEKIRESGASPLDCLPLLKAVDEALLNIMLGKLTIVPKEGGAAVKFIPNSVQRLFLEEVFWARWDKRPIRFIILKARQMGVSTVVAAYFFECARLKGNINVLVVAQTVPDASKMFNQKYVEFLKGRRLTQPEIYKGKVPRGRIEFDDNGSNIYVRASGDQASQGATGQMLHLSEYPWMRDPKGTFGATAPAVPVSADFGVALIIESTGAKVGDDFYEKYYAAKEAEEAGETSGFRAFFWNWLLDKSYTTTLTDMQAKAVMAGLSDYEQSLVDDHGATANQIQWWRDRVREYGEDEARKRYPLTEEQAFGASSESVFEGETLLWYERCQVREPEFKCEPKLVRGTNDCDVNQKDDGRFWVFETPNNKGRYMVIMDAAGSRQGRGNGTRWDKQNSDSAMWVVDEDTGEQCATFCGDMNTIDFAEMGVAVARWYNSAVICPESNNHGEAVIQHLTEVIKYGNIWIRLGDADKMGRRKTMSYGWVAKAKTRDAAIDLLTYVVNNQKIGLHCSRTLAQMRTFVRKPDGRRAAARKMDKDDLVACGWIACATVRNIGSWIKREAGPSERAALIAANREARNPVLRDDAELLAMMEGRTIDQRGCRDSPLSRLLMTGGF